MKRPRKLGYALSAADASFTYDMSLTISGPDYTRNVILHPFRPTSIPLNPGLEPAEEAHN